MPFTLSLSSLSLSSSPPPSLSLSLSLSQIVSPVSGLAKPERDNAVSIKPATSGFTDYDIILSNINITIDVTDDGVFVADGQVGNTFSPETSLFFFLIVECDEQEHNFFYVQPSPKLNYINSYLVSIRDNRSKL